MHNPNKLRAYLTVISHLTKFLMFVFFQTMQIIETEGVIIWRATEEEDLWSSLNQWKIVSQIAKQVTVIC